MRTRAAKSERPAFVFLMVIMLIAVAVTLISAGFARTMLSARAAEMQLDAYRRHHEMLGVRDTVFNFLRGKNEEDLAIIAASGQAAQRIELDDGVTLRITVADGQGSLLLTNVDEIQNEEEREWLLQALTYLPRDRFHDFTRRAGPIRISLRGAPDPVLLAAALGDTRMAEALADAREEEPESQAQLIRELRGRGFAERECTTTAARFDFEPKLWLFQIEAFHPGLGRGFRYDVLAELDTVPKIHDWRLVN